MKLLRASVRSSQKIDKSFEQILNVVFYFVLSLLILNALGFNALVVFGSLSSVILSFSFMISQASSKFIEGLLFIICRRPYDIGVSSTFPTCNVIYFHMSRCQCSTNLIFACILRIISRFNRLNSRLV